MMADYYTHFSFVLELPDEHAIDYAIGLAALGADLYSGSEDDRNTSKQDVPNELKDCLDDWSFEVDRNEKGIWIHSDCSGADAACDFVQHLLAKFGIKEPVSFEWANTCSKPRLDAYSGGAVIITDTRIKSMTTFQWVANEVERMTKRKTASQVKRSGIANELNLRLVS
jgi:hypothetical protein